MIPQFSQPGVKVYPDGREVCLVNTRAGKLIYTARIGDMCKRQSWICCLYTLYPICPGYLHGYPISFEHENGRGGGKRDDRIVLPSGQWINGAAHVFCNMWKGSRRINYNKWKIQPTRGYRA